MPERNNRPPKTIRKFRVFQLYMLDATASCIVFLPCDMESLSLDWIPHDRLTLFLDLFHYALLHLSRNVPRQSVSLAPTPPSDKVAAGATPTPHSETIIISLAKKSSIQALLAKPITTYYYRTKHNLRSSVDSIPLSRERAEKKVTGRASFPLHLAPLFCDIYKAIFKIHLRFYLGEKRPLIEKRRLEYQRLFRQGRREIGKSEGKSLEYPFYLCIWFGVKGGFCGAGGN